MKGFCPCCGYDLVKDQPIILNDFSMFGPGSPLCFQGRAVPLTGYENQLVWTLMKAAPGPVAVDVILDRLGSDAEPNAVSVWVHRIRRKLVAVGAPNIIASSRRGERRAYSWLLKEGQNGQVLLAPEAARPRSAD